MDSILQQYGPPSSYRLNTYTSEDAWRNAILHPSAAPTGTTTSLLVAIGAIGLLYFLWKQ